MKRLFILIGTIFFLLSCKPDECHYAEIDWTSNQEVSKNERLIQFNAEVKGELDNYLNKLGKIEMKVSSLPELNSIVKKYTEKSMVVDSEYAQNYNALVNDLCGTIGLVKDKEIDGTLKEELEAELISKVRNFHAFTKNYENKTKKTLFTTENEDEKMKNQLNELLLISHLLSSSEIEVGLRKYGINPDAIVFLDDESGGVREEGNILNFLLSLGDGVRPKDYHYSVSNFEFAKNKLLASIILKMEKL
jgi:hypothetical protein